MSSVPVKRGAKPSGSGGNAPLRNLSPWLGGLLVLVALAELAFAYRTLPQSTDVFRELIIIHLGSISLGVLLILLFRGGFTFAFFCALLALCVPGVGFFAIAAMLFSFRREISSQTESEPWVLGNPSRYRSSPDSPGEPIEASEADGRGAALWLRHARSRSAVENLIALREDADPFASLYASGALETQLGHLENQIARLRNQVKSAPENLTAQRHLAEALFHLVELQDPKGETGEGVKVRNEACLILEHLGIQNPKLDQADALKTAGERARQTDWSKVADALPNDAPISVREFWTSPPPGQVNTLK